MTMSVKTAILKTFESTTQKKYTYDVIIYDYEVFN